MHQKVLKYREKAAHFAEPGKFEGWIAASQQPTNRSAMSVELRSLDSDEPPYKFAAASSDMDSTDQRAYLQALRDLCEALPNGSFLTVFHRSDYVGYVIDRAETWKSKGWKNSSGSVPNVEIIEQILKVRDERQLKVSHLRCPGGRTEHDEILTRLHDEAHQLAL